MTNERMFSSVSNVEDLVTAISGLLSSPRTSSVQENTSTTIHNACSAHAQNQQIQLKAARFERSMKAARFEVNLKVARFELSMKAANFELKTHLC